MLNDEILRSIKDETEAVQLTLTFLGFTRLGGMFYKEISSNKQISVWIANTQTFEAACRIFGGKFFNKKLDIVERYVNLNVSRVLLGVHKRWKFGR